MRRLRLRLRPAWRRVFRRWYAADGDTRWKGVWQFLEYGSGALLVWFFLSQYAFNPYLIIAGHLVPTAWMETVFWAASWRFFYKSMLGLRLVELGSEWLEVQEAWAWIEANEESG